ncbi:MAG: hypothetical protein ACLGHQ_14925 [Acidimicrobiia bacterium]
MQHRTTRRFALTVAVSAVVVAGCSGEDLIESGLEEAIERGAESEGAGDVDIDFDLDGEGDGSFSMEIDGSEAQMGSNLDVPDWVPDGFPLPDDLNIGLTGTEADGQSVLNGSSTAPAAPLREEILAWLESNGFELLVDTTGDDRFNFVAARGDDVLEGNHGLGGFYLSASQRDVTFERQDAAVVREGAGVATASVGPLEQQFEGTCQIQGGDYRFEATATEATANVSIYAVGDQPPQGSAFVMTVDVESSEFTQYSINFPMGNDDEPQITTGESSFGVSGTWFDMIGGEPVQGSVEVSCNF